MWRKMILGASLAVVVSLGGTWLFVQASDHDDGEIDLKGRALNLTDLYVFREDWQSGNAAHNGNLIFVMNTNPRSMARQQYYFSDKARYEFHVTRIANRDTAPTGSEDVILRLEFGAPNASNEQEVTLTVIKDGETIVVNERSDTGTPILTTPLAGAAAPVVNPLSVDGSALSLFAGLREDPFFFDVTSYFRIRGGAQGSFLPPASAADFTAGYNVNAVALRIPIAFLAGDSGATTFDVWETISIRKCQ